MDKRTATVLKIVALLVSIAAVATVIYLYRDKIEAFFASVKDKINEKRLALEGCAEEDEELADFADLD